MRIAFTLPLLMLAACNVDNDASNDQISVEFNQQRIEDAAEGAANTARDVASGIDNVAESTARAVQNEVGDVNVDVDVNRNDSTAAEGSNTSSKPPQS